MVHFLPVIYTTRELALYLPSTLCDGSDHCDSSDGSDRGDGSDQKTCVTKNHSLPKNLFFLEKTFFSPKKKRFHKIPNCDETQLKNSNSGET